jgi:hypothetical protein
MRWMVHSFGWVEGGNLMKCVHTLYRVALETWGGLLTKRPGLIDVSVGWLGMSVGCTRITSYVIAIPCKEVRIAISAGVRGWLE